MTLGPATRKLALTVHLAVSVGWIGAVVAFLALVVPAMATPDARALRAAWAAMDWIVRFAIVPLALASFVTGVVMALGTRWGLFRHYWVAISLALTIGAIAVLLGNMQAVRFHAAIAAQGEQADVGRLRAGLPSELLHSGVGLLWLLGIQVLNVYKPPGLTAYGRRRQETESPSSRAEERASPPRPGKPLAKPLVIIVAALVLLMLIAHLVGRPHG